MRKHNWLITKIMLSVLLGWTSVSLSAQSTESPLLQGPNESKLEVHISNVTYSCATGIRFDWRLKSASPSVVYIYTPFLAGQAADLLEYDYGTGTVLIPTSTKGEASFPPYSYPEPTFRPLALQEVIEGHFREPISSQLSCKSLRPKKLVFEIAWGTDTRKVLTEIARVKKEGRVHPANPIVHWQKLARSEPAPIKYIGRN